MRLIHSRKKLQQTPGSIDNYFHSYLRPLDKFSSSLSKFCRETYNKEPYFYWMSPYPANLSIYQQKQIDFEQQNKDIDNTIIQQGMYKADRYDIWSCLKHLIIAEHNHFSLHGKQT